MSYKDLDQAVEISKLVKDSKLIIIHVIPEIPTPVFSKEVRSPKTRKVITFAEYMVSLYNEMESEIKEKLEERKKEKYSKYNLDIEIFTTIGKPIDKILDYANEIKVDLIVIGSIGITGVSKYFKGLGSVSRSISEKVSCPILIVR